MSTAIKKALKDFLKGMIPLLTTFLGAVIASVLKTDDVTTTALGAVIGTTLYNSVA